MGFFSNIKKELQDEMDKNKELKDALNTMEGVGLRVKNECCFWILSC